MTRERCVRKHPSQETFSLTPMYNHANAEVQLMKCEWVLELRPESWTLHDVQMSIVLEDNGRFDSDMPTHDKYVCIDKFILEYVPDRHPCRGLDIKLS